MNEKELIRAVDSNISIINPSPLHIRSLFTMMFMDVNVNELPAPAKSINLEVSGSCLLNNDHYDVMKGVRHMLRGNFSPMFNNERFKDDENVIPYIKELKSIAKLWGNDVFKKISTYSFADKSGSEEGISLVRMYLLAMALGIIDGRYQSITHSISFLNNRMDLMFKSHGGWSRQNATFPFITSQSYEPLFAGGLNSFKEEPACPHLRIETHVKINPEGRLVYYSSYY